MFGEGSVLFVIGAGFAMSGLTDVTSPHYQRVTELALVNTPYCVGAVCFTVGAYFGVLKVVNLTTQEGEKLQLLVFSKAHLSRIATAADLRSLGSYWLNFLGAVAFNIDTLATYSSKAKVSLTWGMAALGGLCFTLGGALDCGANRVWTSQAITANWWVSVGNAVGGACFLVPGIVGGLSPSPVVYYWCVDFIYFLGSLSFLLASVCQLWKWKNEQYALGHPEELQSVASPGPSHQDVEYDCQVTSQIPWLLLYKINASLSVVDIAVSTSLPIGDETWLKRSLQALLNFMLCHGVILLGSVIHHAPTKRPYTWLLAYLRLVLLLYTIDSAWSVWQEVRSLRWAAKSGVSPAELSDELQG